MSGFKKPNQNDLQDDRTLADFVNSQHRYPEGAPKTTASRAGTPQYGTTSFTVSDVLQGTFNVRDPADTLAIINKGLTQDLSSLYYGGIAGYNSFSSVPPDPVLKGEHPTGGGSGGDGGGATSGTPHAPAVRKDWVQSLPVKAPSTNAFLWVRQGKSSREMHLGLSGIIEADKQNHLQWSEMPEKWLFPYNMDRVDGDGAGGDPAYIGPRGYVINWGGGDKIIGSTGQTIGNENPNMPGHGGAWGDLNPSEEQYYVAMAWPYKGVEDSFVKAGRTDIAGKATSIKKSEYRGRRLLVYSMKTGAACVCTPGDWGPHPWRTTGVNDGDTIEGSITGLSPDTHFVLGTDHGAEVLLGWMPDSTPLGPYQPTPDQKVETIPNSYSGSIPSATVSGRQHSIEEIIYAGTKIANHPNCWMARDTNCKTVLTAGRVPWGEGDKNVLYRDANGRCFLMPSLLNYLWLILSNGFILDGYAGSIVPKMKTYSPDKVSNHSYGGAIDIGSIGRAKEGRVHRLYDQASKPIVDELFNFLASLPENTRPQDVGSQYPFTYPNGYKVFKDPGHIHIGFDLPRAGVLMTALKKPTTSNTGGRTPV